MVRAWLIPAAIAAGAFCFGAPGEGDGPQKKGAPAQKTQTREKRASKSVSAPPVKPAETKWSDAVEVDDAIPPAIAGALNSPTVADFNESTLKEALQFLGSYHNINVYIDEAGLQNAMIDKNELKITLSLSGVQLRHALNLMLEPHGLTFTIRNEVVEITSADKERQRNVASIYPVADLVVSAGDRKLELRSEEFLECIRKTIDADRWDVNGGDSSATMHRSSLSLVVSAPSSTHRRIVNLLAALRTAKGKLPAGLSASGLPPTEELFTRLHDAPSAKGDKRSVVPAGKQPALANPVPGK